MPLQSQKSRIQVGQWVFLPIGKNRLKAKVLEDRGRLGRNKEHVFLVLLPQEEGAAPQEREVAESRLIPTS